MNIVDVRNNVGKWILFGLVLCCTFFVNNKAIFVDIMESRNMITAREMVYDGNWLTPTMNGELRLEKPPLPTWISAIVEYISPDNLALQRAMAGLAALLLVFYLFRLGKLLTHDKVFSWIIVFVLCTSYNIILMGRTASWDIYCHAFMLMAIYYLFKALRADVCDWKSFLLAGLAMGLSFLGKGPVSFYALLFPFLCAYLICYRKSMAGKWKGCAGMILLMLVLSCWWYAYIYMYHPEMAEYVWNKESSSWANRNVRPWYYYWKFFLETGAWSLLTLFTLFVPVWKKRLGDKTKSYLFSLLWMLFVVFFLSLIPEKKTRYLLPVSIPAALAVGHLFYYWIRQMRRTDRLGKILYLINGLLLAIVVLVLPVMLYLFMYREQRMTGTALILLSAGLWGIAFCLFYAVKSVRPAYLLGGVVGLFAFAEIFLMPYIGSFVSNAEQKSIAITRNIEELQSLPFYHPASEEIRIELVYAAYRKIRALDLTDSAAVAAAMPFVLVQSVEPAAMIPEWLQQNACMEEVDVYDDNPWPKGHRRYSPAFIKKVTIIRKK